MAGILIIEDNAEVRRLIRSEVGALAEQFYEGSDGSQAVALYRRHQPEWVLMDLEMKEMDGLAATRRLKAAFPQANICIVTNYDDEFLREEARNAGVSAYVLKENLDTLPAILNGRMKD
jgi:CheY-like chemotaxis protein